MPWKASDVMSLREEFVRLAQQDDCNMARLVEPTIDSIYISTSRSTAGATT